MMTRFLHKALVTAPEVLRQWIFRSVERLHIGPEMFHVLLATVIGALTGLGGVMFLVLIRVVKAFFFGTLFPLVGSSPYLIFLLPALGGLVIGPLIYYFPKEAKGDGVPAAMEAVALHGGIIHPRTVALRTITSAITIGSGGSVGREAPIAQIGAAVGSIVGQFLRVSGERMRGLVGCGAAGGIAAVFNAPIGGVFFGLEVFLGDFSAQTFSPIVISSVVSVAVLRAILGNVLIFRVPQFVLASFPQMLLCAALGVVCGAAAYLFSRLLTESDRRFSSSPIPIWLRAAVGGALTGLIAIAFPQVLGTDITALDQAVHGYLPWTILLAVGLLKILATSFSLGSGGSGGVLGPSIFIGGIIGALAGTMAEALFPTIAGSVGGYTLIGMAAFLGPVVGAPLTAILILFEISGNYAIILPLLVAVICAMFVFGRFSRFSLYTYHLHKKGVDLVRGREEGVLKTLTVREVMRHEATTIASSASFRTLATKFLEAHTDYFYLTDENGALNGVVSFRDIRPYLMEEGLSDLVLARDIATANPVSVTPEESLFDALMKFGYKNVEILPVVVDPHSRKLIGAIRRKEVLEAYQKRIMSSIRED